MVSPEMLDDNNNLPSLIVWPLTPKNKSPLLYLDFALRIESCLSVAINYELSHRVLISPIK